MMFNATEKNNNIKIYFFRVELLVKTIVKIIALTRPLCIIENSANL